MKCNTQLRKESIQRILHKIRQCGPISKRELQSMTGFSWGNISSIITLLMNEQYIVASGKQETSVGRKPAEFEINIHDHYIIGIDFNSEGVIAVVCDLRGRVVSKQHIFFTQKSKKFVLDDFSTLIEKILSYNKDKNIFHIALAMQGEVDVENGVSVRISDIDEWVNIPICEWLENRFGINTVMLHDPDCLLYTEKYFGVLDGKEINNAVLLRIDHGVGMACMLGGKIYMGNRGRTCEIGMTAVPTEQGWSLFKNVVKEKAVEKRYAEITGCSMNCSAIADVAYQGEKEAIRVFAEIGNALGFALNNAVSFLNPDALILYGDFTKYSKLFLDEAKKVLQDFLADEMPDILLSNLDDTAAAVGAALFAADHVIEELDLTS